MKVNWATSPGNAPKQDTSSKSKTKIKLNSLILHCPPQLLPMFLGLLPDYSPLHPLLNERSISTDELNVAALCSFISYVGGPQLLL